jgi:hypothetical protein
VRVLDALDQVRKAYRACRHDPEAAERVAEAGAALRHAADLLRARLSPQDQEHAEQLHELRRVDE